MQPEQSDFARPGVAQNVSVWRLRAGRGCCLYWRGSMQNRAAACYPLWNNTMSILGMNIFWHADQEGRARTALQRLSRVSSIRNTCFTLITNLLQCSCSVCALCRLSACLLVMLSCEGRPVRPHYDGPAQTRVLEALSERQILMSQLKACKEAAIEECSRVWSVSLRACSLQCCASSVHETAHLQSC